MTQRSYVEVFGSEVSDYMDNYFINVASSNLMGNAPKSDNTLIFNFKELKCTCPSEERKELPDFMSRPLSVGDSFLQYFYLA